MIKITIESFDLKLNEQGYNNKVNDRTWLELTFDPDDRVNKEEAMDIVRSVLLPGTHPIVEWPDKQPIYAPVDLKIKVTDWRHNCMVAEQDHRKAENKEGVAYHRGGIDAFTRILDELQP